MKGPNQVGTPWREVRVEMGAVESTYQSQRLCSSLGVPNVDE